MQLRGWALTRASRIVIILLVVQHVGYLGLGQILVVASTRAAEPGPVDPAWTVPPPEAVLSPAVVADPAPGHDDRDARLLDDPAQSGDPSPPAAERAASRLSSAEAGVARPFHEATERSALERRSFARAGADNTHG